jgi:cell division protease FtsH
MVMRFGMSEKLGPRVFGHDHGQPFLGREFSTEPDYSDEIAREIDDEVRRIIEGAHERARKLLNDHRERLDTISQILVRRETIEKQQFEALLGGADEAEAFGPDDVVVPDAAAGAPVAPKRPRPEAKRPLRRPGLAGGTTELRGSDPGRTEL